MSNSQLQIEFHRTVYCFIGLQKFLLSLFFRTFIKAIKSFFIQPEKVFWNEKPLSTFPDYRSSWQLVLSFLNLVLENKTYSLSLHLFLSSFSSRYLQYPKIFETSHLSWVCWGHDMLNIVFLQFYPLINFQNESKRFEIWEKKGQKSQSRLILRRFGKGLK